MACRKCSDPSHSNCNGGKALGRCPGCKSRSLNPVWVGYASRLWCWRCKSVFDGGEP